MTSAGGEATYALVGDLSQLGKDADRRHSRTVHSDERARVVLFSFEAGQELPEHAAPNPAFLQVVTGFLTLWLDGTAHAASAGAWAFMPPGLPHAVQATEPSVMLLTLLRDGGGSDRP